MNVERDYPVAVHERNPLIRPYFNLLPGHTRGIYEGAPILYASFHRQGLIQRQTQQLGASISEFSSVIQRASPHEKYVVMRELRAELGQNGEESFLYYKEFADAYVLGQDTSEENIQAIVEFHRSLWTHVNNVQAVSLCPQFSLEERDFIREGMTPEAFRANFALLESTDRSLMNFNSLFELIPQQ